MEQQNNEQNSVIFSIAEILGRMSNQVGFLIRNNKLMSQLDVDMLMENTRKLYDMVCSVRCNMDVDSIPMEVESGGANMAMESGAGADDEEQVDMVWDFTVDDDVEEEKEQDVEKDDDGSFEEYDAEEESDDDEIYEECDAEEENDEDDFYEEDEDDDNEEEEEHQESDSGIRAYKIVREEPKSNNQPATLGDVYENAEDTSLAARLQKKPITDLTTAIGINDKFLLLNELFSGSMEKYNRSIKALNNFTTYLGAVTYMSELQIEFQWDCESEAYKKLNDLVERRFISIHNS